PRRRHARTGDGRGAGHDERHSRRAHRGARQPVDRRVPAVRAWPPRAGRRHRARARGLDRPRRGGRRGAAGHRRARLHPAGARRRRRARRARPLVIARARAPIAGRAIAAGLLLAASLPPWGWWPLAFVGLALADGLIAGQPAWVRFRRGWLVAAALLFPTLSWIASFTAPGYVIAAAYYSGVFALACMACPPRAPARWVALPGAWMLAEAFRDRWPFGGVPVSRLAMGQVDSPLVHVVRVGGTLLLDLVTVAAGMAVAA